MVGSVRSAHSPPPSHKVLASLGRAWSPMVLVYTAGVHGCLDCSGVNHWPTTAVSVHHKHCPCVAVITALQTTAPPRLTSHRLLPITCTVLFMSITINPFNASVNSTLRTFSFSLNCLLWQLVAFPSRIRVTANHKVSVYYTYIY